MDFATPSFIIEDIRARLNHPILGYPIYPDELYTSIINWMQTHHHLHINKDEILFTPSVVSSIDIAIQAFSEIGDNILIQPPNIYY